MKTVQWDPSYSKKIVMKGMTTIKVAFRIFDIPPKNLHTHTHTHTHTQVCRIILLTFFETAVAIHIAED